MTNEKHNKKMRNALEAQAKKHLRELRRASAGVFLKICDGDMVAALNAILKAYGKEYGKNEQEIDVAKCARVADLMECVSEEPIEGAE